MRIAVSIQIKTSCSWLDLRQWCWWWRSAWLFWILALTLQRSPLAMHHDHCFKLNTSLSPPWLFFLQIFIFRSEQQRSCLVWKRLGLLGLAGHFERVPGKRKKTMFLMIIRRKCWHQHQKNVWATCQGWFPTKSTGKRGQQWNAGALALKRSWCPNSSIQ